MRDVELNNRHLSIFSSDLVKNSDGDLGVIRALKAIVPIVTARKKTAGHLTKRIPK